MASLPHSRANHFLNTNNFRIPTGNSPNITVKLIDEAKALTSCKFLAIDDIKAVVNAKVNVKFDTPPLGICYIRLLPGYQTNDDVGWINGPSTRRSMAESTG